MEEGGKEELLVEAPFSLHTTLLPTSLRRSPANRITRAENRCSGNGKGDEGKNLSEKGTSLFREKAQTSPLKTKTREGLTPKNGCSQKKVNTWQR